MTITAQEYWKEIESLANDIISEVRDELGDSEDYDSLRELCSERAWETIDGHQWIIYYSYNLSVIEHSDNPDAWEETGGTEYAGQLLADKGLNGLHAYIACNAMTYDLQAKIEDIISEME